jgi:hypothetical protein
VLAIDVFLVIISIALSGTILFSHGINAHTDLGQDFGCSCHDKDHIRQCNLSNSDLSYRACDLSR